MFGPERVIGDFLRLGLVEAGDHVVQQKITEESFIESFDKYSPKIYKENQVSSSPDSSSFLVNTFTRVFKSAPKKSKSSVGRVL